MVAPFAPWKTALGTWPGTAFQERSGGFLLARARPVGRLAEGATPSSKPELFQRICQFGIDRALFFGRQAVQDGLQPLLCDLQGLMPYFS